MNLRIYQVNISRDDKRVAFMGLDEREHFLESSKIDSSIYDCVFSGEVNCGNLEDVFQKFNIDHPDGYAGRSLSVSDVVEIVDSENVDKGFYYCDNIGFSKVEFDPEEAEPYKDEKIKVLMVEPGKKAYERERDRNKSSRNVRCARLRLHSNLLPLRRPCRDRLR